MEVGPLRISFHPVPHFIDAYGMSVESANGDGRFVYGGDSGPAAELVELARGADLLLVEATLPQPEADGDRGHQTPEEAGEQARDAGVKKVVITHISDELDQEDARRRASEAFGAPVEVAREGAVYDICEWASAAPGTLAGMTHERDLFANFERMRREIDELFGDVFERTGFRGPGFAPAVDVYYMDGPPRAVVRADLAGVLIDDVELEIRGRQLVIAGERRVEQGEGCLYQQIEIEHGPFRRVGGARR